MPTFIDFFAGAGGLSEGFIKAGYVPIAHVEMKKDACDTLKTRAAYHYLREHNQLDIYENYLRNKREGTDGSELWRQVPVEVTNRVIQATIGDKTMKPLKQQLDQLAGGKPIDIIIGGPPCQAYSIAGRARLGESVKDDPRNYLYKYYLRFIRHFKPKMFVFENVMGIESANGGKTWKNIQKYLKRVGYEIKCHEQNSKDFGVLQNRRRMIIVGWQKNSHLKYPEFPQKKVDAIVNDLFSDLPKLHPGESCGKYAEVAASEFVTSNGIRMPEDVLTLHASRPNKERDIRIYIRAVELWNNGHKRLNYNDLPEELKTHQNRSSFLDRFKVVEGDESCCHTMLAHISKDGHYFIHPDITQHRSITVREAARIQSFPDNYFFEGPRTAQFVQIGNAVPPMMAKGIANGVISELQREEKHGRESCT